MRSVFLIILPLATYLFFGLLFEFTEYFAELAGYSSGKYVFWKGFKFVFPAIPAAAVLRGILSLKTHTVS
jgi:hypothetical protein